MYVTMLGTGAPFPDPDRAQSGILVTLDNGARYMFDCGNGTVRNMVAANANPAEVKAVFLTHLHHDHICDFPLFAIAGWMWDRPDSPIVLGPKGTGHFCKMLFEGGAFDADFRARSAYPLRQQNLAAMRPDVREVQPGLAYEDEDVKILCDWVEHIPREISECFGIRLEAEGKAVAFSGDTAPCDAVVRLARDADVLIHECTFPQVFVDYRARTGVGTCPHPAGGSRQDRARRGRQAAGRHPFRAFRIDQHGDPHSVLEPLPGGAHGAPPDGRGRARHPQALFRPSDDRV